VNETAEQIQSNQDDSIKTRLLVEAALSDVLKSAVDAANRHIKSFQFELSINEENADAD
jgi:hypothetical protein